MIIPMNRCFFFGHKTRGVYNLVLNRHCLFVQEKKEFEQKFSKEQAALREQLQVRQSFHYSNMTWLLSLSGLLSTLSSSWKPTSFQENWESQLARLYLNARALCLTGLSLCGSRDVVVASRDFLHWAPFSFSKVHIQTIGILVSEKSELQTALGHTQQAARQKSGNWLGALQLELLVKLDFKSGARWLLAASSQHLLVP